MDRYKDDFFAIISKPTRFTLKLTALGILFILMYIKIFDVFVRFKTPIIPNDIYLVVSLIIIVYIWIIDSIDTQKYLLSQNEIINLQRRLRDEQINTITSLILFQEAKDYYARGHTVRVTQYAIFLAKKLNLSEKEIGVLECAAKLHDIGKIGISDLILNKPDTLTEEEKHIIQEHAEFGDNVLKPLEFLKKERLLVRQHHEHYDGKGYPEKLKGEDILIGARILAICDFYDAVSSDRPYRKALTQVEIIEELNKNRGTQFDPKIAELLLELMQKEPQTLRRIAESVR